jgi:hypothetical protein
MYRLSLRHTVPIAAIALVALGLSFFFFAGRASTTEAPPGTVAQDSAAQADSIAAATEQPEPVVSDTPPTLPTDTTTAPPVRYRTGEDPGFATRMGWPVNGPEPLPGSILPHRRIVAYYGNPLSRRMGVLGEYAPDEMLQRFDKQIEEWRKADPDTPVQPALHLVTVVAAGEPGPSGKYRTIMRDTMVEMVHRWAKSRNAILFIDIQVGHSDIRELVNRFDKFLTQPDVHFAVDPEFMMKTGHKPGAKIGTMDAADINYVSDYLAKLVKEHNLPPKVLVIHRFTRGMVTNAKQIKLRPEVQVVMDMDGWGASWLKRDSYRDYIVREPVQYTGFKLFYHNDTKKGDPLMTPAEVLKLRPMPLYIQYQ